jgi:hypothetical protein
LIVGLCGTSGAKARENLGTHADGDKNLAMFGPTLVQRIAEGKRSVTSGEVVAAALAHEPFDVTSRDPNIKKHEVIQLVEFVGCPPSISVTSQCHNQARNPLNE